MFLSGKKILLTTAAIATAVRIAAFIVFRDSFFAGYHLVPGLDMQTLLRFSEWGNGENSVIFFTFHRLLIFLEYLVCGKEHCVWIIFAVQSIIGITGTLCITDLILKLTGKRKTALFCGILSAMYMPLIVYELSVLQETFMVNFALFSLWSMFYALHKRFTIPSALLLAFSLFAALAGRPAALFMCTGIIVFSIFKMAKRKLLKRTVLPAAVLLILLSGASLFNYLGGQHFSPFYNVMPYTLQYNAIQESPQQPASLFQAARNAVGRVPRLFKYGELPENQNVYFWCEKLPFFDLLPGPGLPVPGAVAAIAVIILSGEWKKRYGIILAAIAFLTMPLCAREAIGRYRLMLIPYFFIICGCGAAVFMRTKDFRHRIILSAGIATGIFFSIYRGAPPEKIRLSDYAAYAIAAANTPETPEQIITEQCRIYWEKSLFSSEPAFTMYADRLMRTGDFKNFFPVAGEAISGNKVNPDLVHYFTAIAFAMQNMPYEVDMQLKQLRDINSLSPPQRKNVLLLRNKTDAILEKLKK